MVGRDTVIVSETLAALPYESGSQALTCVREELVYHGSPFRGIHQFSFPVVIHRSLQPSL